MAMLVQLCRSSVSVCECVSVWCDTSVCIALANGHTFTDCTLHNWKLSFSSFLSHIYPSTRLRSLSFSLPLLWSFVFFLFSSISYFHWVPLLCPSFSLTLSKYFECSAVATAARRPVCIHMQTAPQCTYLYSISHLPLARDGYTNITFKQTHPPSSIVCPPPPPLYQLYVGVI